MIDLQTLDRAYKEMLATPAGQIIKADLESFCRISEVLTPEVSDRDVLKYREMQNIYNYIVGDKYIEGKQ